MAIFKSMNIKNTLNCIEINKKNMKTIERCLVHRTLDPDNTLIPFQKLNQDELFELRNIITEELNKRNETEPKKFLFDPTNRFQRDSRFGEGWTKTVTGLDKSTTTGYSIIGEFKPKKKDWYNVGKLYLDLGIWGSNKYQNHTYTLFTMDESGEVVILKEIENSKNWAVDLWETIEKYLNN